VRRAKRITLLAIGLSVLALLALGALPQYLGGGETYYMTATEVEEPDDRPAVDASEIDSQRFPYMSEALETGTSEGYETGPVEVKEWFTHTPFDERDAVADRNPDAVEDGTVYVERNGTLYRVEVTRDP
jgi:hypothetical protein